jgi:sulfite reductase (NADPH) flavoprotein alpha-component
MTSKPILVLFGTVTGNAEQCAKDTVDSLRAAGLEARAANMSEYPTEQLSAEQTVLVIVSTFGDGEPPIDAEPFWQAVCRGEALDLSRVRFAVFGLGDTAYEFYCQCGKDFDAAFERHGARRLRPRADVDTEFEKPFRQWLAELVGLLIREPLPATT